MQNLQHKRSALALKATDVADDGTFQGYGSVFGVVDNYQDVVSPGAFKVSLARYKSEGRLPAMLWQHDGMQPIGRWSELREDDKGLWCAGRLILDVGRAREAHALLK